MTFRSLAVLILYFTLAQVPLASHAESYDDTWRFSSIAIPKLQQPPIIDGTINETEWARATLFPPTVEMEPHKRAGLPMRKRTWIWMGYTSDSIYVAWRQELPSERLPLEVTITNERDRLEGPDNAVHIMLNPTDAGGWFPFHIAGNGASQLFDRKLDDPGLLLRWNPDVTYKSHLIATGWEGELQIPFKELGMASAPADGTKWKCNFFSFWRKGGVLLSSWPFVRWNGKGERGTIIFAGDAPSIRFEQAGVLTVVGGDAQVQTKLFYRKERARQSFQEQVLSAIDASQGEGATFENFSKIVGDALAGFQPASAAEEPGEYLLRFDVKAGDRLLAAGITPVYKAAPLELDVTPMYLQTHKLIIEATSELPQAHWLEANLQPAAGRAKTGEPRSGERGYDMKRVAFASERAEVEYPTETLKEGNYELAAAAKDVQDQVVAKATMPIVKAAAPDWWTMKEGVEPRVPPPWTPVRVEDRESKIEDRKVKSSPSSILHPRSSVSILGRRYDFTDLAVPSQITTRGQKILAGPMEFRAAKPWEKSKLRLVKKDDEAAVFESESVAADLALKVRSQVEFDGFMYVDVEVAQASSLRFSDAESSQAGSSRYATLDKLDFVIPFKKEHAILVQNYVRTAGPGDGQIKNPNAKNPYQSGKRYAGYVPDYTLQTPPMLTTWIGTDHYGLEWSCESSRGWSMQKPSQAMEISRDGDKVLLTIHLISKPVKLSADKPRRIRFGLIATPTKALPEYLKRMRFQDNCVYDHATMTRFPFWHEPLKDPALIEKNKKTVEAAHALGAKLLFHGGWNISTQSPDWDSWLKEMVSEPAQNVSFGDAKQFAACWHSPWGSYMANTFGYNAKLLGFDGIRWDTVVPSYECKSLAHGCGWYDDDGNLQPSSSIYSQREVWKRMYRIFHGGRVKEGVIYDPNAAGPIMAVDSFSDFHEIGEGYYMHAKLLKDAFPPDMIRANMTGDQYGFRSSFNIKGSPIFPNARIGVVLVNGSEPRMGDYRFWRPGYAGQDVPAVGICDAWDWVDKWNAQWLGWWENGEYVRTAAGDRMIYASMYLQPGKKVLLLLANYEADPLDEFDVRLNLARTGLKGPLYAEDAITLDPVPVSADGALKLDVLGERYRIIKISNEPPRYRPEARGPNLLANTPAEIDKTWTSADIVVEPNSTYVLTAQIKMDKHIGEGSANPNRVGAYNVEVNHCLTMQFTGDGIGCINATNKIALATIDIPKPMAYRDTEIYKRNSVEQFWERTPGWTSVLIPFGTATNASRGKVAITITDAGQAVVKELALQKVK